MFFYHIPSSTFTWDQWNQTQDERREGSIIVYNVKTDKFKVASPTELIESGLKDTFTWNQIKNIRFFDYKGEMLHEEYDIRHILRQAKRKEDISVYMEILCGTPVIRIQK